ncbi:CDGSH iron-sulfur domain-containing protein [Gordonia alkanivorans]|uniref:CDGSH iron-sulfur domain-containing protein n=1 Tax=Gordonia alkanivorans TaxID=84096 RepID=UPI000FDD1E36|nr:CDGSH iron-sulfur domain-containing protein [Gordonia alkanivorans]AZZ82816.1 CDGSH iron-sulfur domain-containing protein [Gordonia alkanivorans]
MTPEDVTVAQTENGAGAERTAVRVVRGGPVLVEGPVDIELPDGCHVQSDRFMVAICACGRSKNYPLCDTSHRKRRRRAAD